MSLRDYFEEHQGHGVLGTVDAEGRVNLAVFARPHVLEDGTVGFIMPDRRTHANLQASPNAAYLFHADPGEDGNRYAGKRLRLRKVGEEKDTERLKSLRRRTYDDDRDGRFLVLFAVEEELPLVGPGGGA